MDYSKENQNWDSLSYVENSQAQHDKSLHDLIEKMDKKE